MVEADGRTARSLHCAYNREEVLGRVASSGSLVKIAENLLGGAVYVYQIKINLKAPFDGEAWPWHQDFAYWKAEDGMKLPSALTVGIFLDEVSAVNGPMFFIPGSQGIEVDSFNAQERQSWEECFSTRLPYQVSGDVVKALAEKHGIVAPVGPPGTGVLFHSNVIHASPGNISPFARRLLLLTYNRIDNAVTTTSRPNILVNSIPSL